VIVDPNIELVGLDRGVDIDALVAVLDQVRASASGGAA
jgi:hypothetical protein